MATIGVSRPYYGLYSYDDETKAVKYTLGAVMGKATEVDLEIETTDDNNLYGDNAIAETDRQFSGGTLSVSTTDLSQSVSQVILGLAEQLLEPITGVTDANVRELIYDNRQQTPYLGVGFVIKKRVNGATLWRAVVLTKVMFSVPSDSATTQGETIEWQVPTLSATIMRDDSANQTWKREATFTSEAQAVAYLEARLGVGVNPELGTLTVVSTAGTTAGQTVISVSPALEPGDHYLYQTGASVTLPTEYGESVAEGWTAWDGVSPLTATSGNEVAIVEATLDNLAVAAGKTDAVVGTGD